MWRPVLVVAVVALAGCTGLLASGDTATSRKAVTPAPVPETTEPAVDLPYADGNVDLDRILDRHAAVLADRNFHRHVEREGPQNTHDVWVDREGGVVRVRQTFGPLNEGVVVADGVEYRNVRDDPDTDYVRAESDGRVPYVSSLSGASVIRGILTAEGYDRLGTVRRGGRTLAVVGSNDTDIPISGADPDQTVAVRSRLYVDRQGVVRYVDHWERRSDGSTMVFVMSVRTGIVRVPVPWWADDVGIYEESVSGSM
ncbi:hypothetical protein [Haloarcula marina]|uniref:hypothetical protein n=1 Tax=Haloarcula marina TaxID=2961574 RepID=UPI0020B77761|nr:hypothetical protein [Halomicroarcula marina]